MPAVKTEPDDQTVRTEPLPMKKIKLEHDPMDIIESMTIDLTSEDPNEAEAALYPVEKIAQDEVDRYWVEPASNDDALLWWKKREVLFPNVSQVAKIILALPASSVPSERIFSLAGNIVSKKRSSLTSSNVDMLIFLHKNFNKIQ
jgi:hypothetical protein